MDEYCKQRPILAMRAPNDAIRRVARVNRQDDQRDVTNQFPGDRLAAVDGAPDHGRLVCRLPTPIHRHEDEGRPIDEGVRPSTQDVFERVSYCLGEDVPRLTRLVARVVRLQYAYRLFQVERERHRTIVVLIHDHRTGPREDVYRLPAGASFTFKKFANGSAFGLLIRVTVGPYAEFSTERFPYQVRFIAVRPISTRALRVSLLVGGASAISIIRELCTYRHRVSPTLFLRDTRLLSREFKHVRQDSLPSPSLRRVVNRATTRALIRL